MAQVPTIVSREEWDRLKQQQEISTVMGSERSGSDFLGLVLRPQNTYFATQDPGESVYILVRRHWFTNLSWASSASFLVIAPFLVQIVLTLINVNIWQILGFKLLTVILLFYYSVIATYVVKNIIDWYFNLYIVTNQRIMDYDFISFARNDVSEVALTSLEDVKQTTVGLIPSIFNYGNVEIYSAAEKKATVFHDVPQPTLVRDKISDLAKIAKRQNGSD